MEIINHLEYLHCIPIRIFEMVAIYYTDVLLVKWYFLTSLSCPAAVKEIEAI
jgi:hypothetical protein